MSARDFNGNALVPGVNVDRVDVAAGLAMLASCGYAHTQTRDVIRYALQRWARGEGQAAERGAIDRSFYGIDLTSWRMVLAAAVAAGEAPEGDGVRAISAERDIQNTVAPASPESSDKTEGDA